MNTEALFLFLILLLGLLLCSFLGGNCNRESFTGDLNDKLHVNTKDVKNASSDTKISTSFDNYNHFSGLSSQLTNGTTFYGKNGGSVDVKMQSNGTPILYTKLAQDQEPIILSNSPPNNSTLTTATATATSSNSNQVSSQIPLSFIMTPLSSVFGNSPTLPNSDSVVENRDNANSNANSQDEEFYGPNGETGKVINYNGNKAIQINTKLGSHIFTLNNHITTNETISSPFNLNYSTYNNTPSTYFGSTGVNGANVNNNNKAYNDSTSQSQTKPQSQSTYMAQSASYDYSNSLPKGIPRNQIPPGKEDLYILKSEVVPPVCPACPPATTIPRQEKCPPCPACARCPEPSFECKKVPNYNAINNQYLPIPVLNDFSTFGM